MPAARRISDALAQTAAGSTLLERYAASQRAAVAVESEIKRIVPDLAPIQSGVCDLHGGALRLNVRSPAQVAKLRQAAPRLLSRLRQQGLDVSEIKFGVQPRASSASTPSEWPAGGRAAGTGLEIPARTRANLSAAKEFSSKLLLTIKNSPLREALRHLDERLAMDVARMRESEDSGNQKPREEHNP
jgi:hypothetical protein